MEKPDYSDEQLDKFLMGLFDENEEKRIQAALTGDQELSLRLQERKDLMLGIEAYHARGFKDKLKEIHNKSFGTATVKKEAKRRSLLPWLAAAAIAMLVVAFFLLNNASTNTNALYADNFKPYELSISQRDNTDEQLAQLLSLYDQGQYKEAIPVFNTLLTAENSNPVLRLGAGISELEEGDLVIARGHFEAILQSGDILYKDHAQWYLALTHLKSEDIEATKTALQVLVKDNDADHHQEAVELLERLP